MGAKKLTLLLFILLFAGASAYADSLVPEAITDLDWDYVGCVEGEVRLTWTAPHEDGTYGGKVYAVTLENGGLLIEYNDGYNLPADVKDLAEAAIAGVKDGSIDVGVGE